MKYLSFLLPCIAFVLAGCASFHESSQDTAGVYNESCKITSEEEIVFLFERWNQSLQTGDASMVVENYAERSILLPTVSNRPRFTVAEKEDYFLHFLKDAPAGRIDQRTIDLGCNMAVDSGLYTFTFAKTGQVVSGRYSFVYRWDGAKWRIISHHSSAMPERKQN